MKKLLKYLLLLVLPMAMFAVTSCDDDDDKSPLVGAWEIKISEEEEESYTVDYKFLENGKGYASDGEETKTFTWKTEGDKITIKFDGDEYLMEGTYVLDGNKLLITHTVTDWDSDGETEITESVTEVFTKK